MPDGSVRRTETAFRPIEHFDRCVHHLLDVVAVAHRCEEEDILSAEAVFLKYLIGNLPDALFQYGEQGLGKFPLFR